MTSFVIPAHDEERLIGPTIEALGLLAGLLRPGADRRRSGHWYLERRADPAARPRDE